MPTIRQYLAKNQLLFSTIFFMGWLLGLLVDATRMATIPARSYTTALILAQIGLLFLAAFFARKTPRLEHFRINIRYLAPAWLLSVLVLATTVHSPVWHLSIELWAVLPYAYLWLQSLIASGPCSRFMYLSSWMGMALFTGIFSFITTTFPDSSGLILILSLLPLILVGAACPSSKTPPATAPTLKLNKVSAAALAMFFVMGMGLSDVTEWVGDIHRLPLATSLFFGIASALALSVLLISRHPQHFLAYFAALFLTIALLGYMVPESAILSMGLQVIMLGGATLLSIWWSLRLLSQYATSLDALAFYTSITALTIAVGWTIPLLTGPRPSLLMIMVSILLVTIMSPMLIDHTNSHKESVAGPIPSRTPEAFFNSSGLTPQERRIVQLLLKGYSNQAIIKELYISINTLKTHLKNIYRKTETKNRHDLIDHIGGYRQEQAN